MKLITFAVPCYNSAPYMERCIKTLLAGGDEVEILLVDDGSTDATGEVADRYAANYPGIVRAIHQPNGGHGEGINQGLRNAAGLYFKVVDSDDWLDEKALLHLLKTIRTMKEPIDLYLCNYVYENAREKKSQSISFRNVFPAEKRLSWDEIGRFRLSQYLVMHTMIFRTEILLQCGLELPKHTFYVDNIFAYIPLPYTKSLYYIDMDLYRYFIGRDDQSVNEKIMIQRVDQQVRITRIMKNAYSYAELQTYRPKLCRYMITYLTMMMVISTVFLNLSGTAENRAKRDALWEELKRDDPAMYRKIRRRFLGFLVSLPGAVGEKITIFGYHLSRKLYKFN